jgi:hypothetical protein
MTEKPLRRLPTDVAAVDTRWRPRWYFFGLFAVLAAIHLADGWSDTDAIGLPVGFACTVVLVFVRRLPAWVTGEWSPRPWSRSWLRARRHRLAVGVPVVALVVGAAFAVGMIDHPPHGVDILYCVFVWACGLGALAFALVRWVTTARTLHLLAGSRTVLPARINQQDLPDDGEPAPFVAGTVTFPDGSPGFFTLRDCPLPLLGQIRRSRRLHVNPPRPGTVVVGLPDVDDFARGNLSLNRVRPHGPPKVSRAALGGHVHRRTLALWVVMASGAVLEVTAFMATPGPLPWMLLVVVLLGVMTAAYWRGQVARPARLLAAGPWTAVTAAVFENEVWLDRAVSGWAVFPGGVRARFSISNCPPDVTEELLGRRRLWIAGKPREGEAAVGIPDGDTVAVARFAVKAREHRRARARLVPG